LTYKYYRAILCPGFSESFVLFSKQSIKGVVMKLRKGSRGLLRGNFKDQREAKCSIQESSLATDQCIWLGVDETFEGEVCPARMHLTVDMVRDLLPHLQKFAESGNLEGAPAKDGEVVGIVIESATGKFLTRKLVWETRDCIEDAFVHPDAAFYR
jgi:hypothetical protein